VRLEKWDSLDMSLLMVKILVWVTGHVYSRALSLILNTYTPTATLNAPAPSTPIPELVGQPAPAFMALNANDAAFFKLGLDQKSADFAVNNCTYACVNTYIHTCM
jgi:hypothetical protein